MNFTGIAKSAFPPSSAAEASHAATLLGEAVNSDYPIRTMPFMTEGQEIYMPYRINFFTNLEELLSPNTNSAFTFCLISRSANGFVRQKALRYILRNNHPSIAPYIANLAAEYVVEIADDIRLALPMLDPAVYRNFVLENRTAVRTLRSRATSCWNEYYRCKYPNSASYPGLIFFKQLEIWAS